jgi:hypothetical protein
VFMIISLLRGITIEPYVLINFARSFAVSSVNAPTWILKQRHH